MTMANREWMPLVVPELLLSLSPSIKGWQRRTRDGTLSLYVGLEPDGWHLSISHSARYPTWDEIKDARYQFCPNEVTMAMLLPPIEQYVNIHERTFHLWQVES